jgi:uncharacterized damage-inducible protein DinB
MFTQEEITKAFGPYSPPARPDDNFIQQSIQEIELFPKVLKAFFDKLEPDHQKSCYREGGWNIRQVIHHIADSHMQALTRFKLAVTEDHPTIKPYHQNDWANTDDSLFVDAKYSIQIIEGVHARWTALLKSMNISDLNRTYYHPEQDKDFKLWEVLGLYAWHGRHHYTQIYRHVSNMGWI